MADKSRNPYSANLERNLFLFQRGNFSWGRIIANRLAMPQLLGLWHMAYNWDSGAPLVVDLSGAVRHLTINGNPTFGVYQATGLPEVPYIDLDGTGDYLSHADSAWNSITGALTLMGWWKPDDATPAAFVTLAGHHVLTGNQRSYVITSDVAGTVTANISADGITNVNSIASSGVMADATWHHVAMRYIPSTELSIFLNGVETLNTTTIAAAAFNSTGAFALGARGDGSTPVSGHMALWSLHAAALSDETIAADLAQSRSLFGI